MSQAKRYLVLKGSPLAPQYLRRPKQGPTGPEQGWTLNSADAVGLGEIEAKYERAVAGGASCGVRLEEAAKPKPRFQDGQILITQRRLPPLPTDSAVSVLEICEIDDPNPGFHFRYQVQSIEEPTTLVWAYECDLEPALVILGEM